MIQIKRLRVSIKNLLLALLVCACLLGMWRALKQARHSRDEFQRLSQSPRDHQRRAHRVTQLEITHNGNAVSGPLAVTNGDHWFGGNLSVKNADGKSQTFSYRARHVYSVGREDVYLLFWSTKGRLPPVPSLSDARCEHLLVSIVDGENSIVKNDQWELKFVAHP